MATEATVKASIPVRVSEAGRDGLGRVRDAREAELGRKVTLAETLEFLIDFCETHGLGIVRDAREAELSRKVTLAETLEFLIDFWETH